MNIYFSCSLTGGRGDQAVYERLVDDLLQSGHIVPTAHLARSDVMDLERTVVPQDIYLRDMAWIEACDALVAEVSTPSHGVGYEIAAALGLGKPVLCCYRRGAVVSKMITGNQTKGLRVEPYDDPDHAVAIVRAFLEEAGRAESGP
ncbi:MAG: nucleoside 2-deoxyribosyltransferase [Anaerolineales bacterium]